MAVERKTGSFADFTRENYRRLLLLAKQRYPFAGYDDYKGRERFVIWRHDVDSSLNSAVKLARIEAEEGVQAYYFLHLHNVLYNPLEREMSDLVREIRSLGHGIGLHFDTAYYDIRDLAQMEKWLRFEAGLLEELFGAPISTFSFHNPTDVALGCLEETYAGLVNATSQHFRTSVGYCSDSNGYWRYRRLEDVLKEGCDERLQVLTHPEWWQEEVMSPRERIWRCIDGRAAAIKTWYEAALRSFGRENLDWDE